MLKQKTEILVELRKMDREFIQQFVCALSNDPLNEVELDTEFDEIDDIIEDLKKVDFILLRETFEDTHELFEDDECDCDEEEVTDEEEC